MKKIKKAILILVAILLVSFLYLYLSVNDEFKSQENPASNSPLAMFDKSAVIFDAITIYGTNGVPAEKLKHAAMVAAQWLDNNQDGKIDDENLQKALIENKAVVIMSKDGFSTFPMVQIMTKFSGHALQDLSAEETNNPSRRDASQEEIHHIIMNAGFQKMLPKIFSDQESEGSTLYKIWKYANDNGFYAYDDPTCDDACKTTEFVYLATAAYLDSQADLFSDEMRVKTREALKEKLPKVIEIFESNAYIYPIHLWPDGNYKYDNNIKYFGIDKEEETSTSLLSEVAQDLPDYKIAFASPRHSDDNQDIWTVNVDGTGERNLTEDLSGGFDIYPEWSPDAKYIYYTSNKHSGETLELYRVNTTGNPKLERITNLGREVRSLSISPENKHIALGVMSTSVPLGADLKSYSADLYILDINKMEERLAAQKLVNMTDLQLVLSEPLEKHIWHEQPDWEPKKTDTESRIAYVRTQNYDNDPIMVDEIWSVSMDGSNNKMISKEGSMPRWTIDGKNITTHEFYVIDIDSNKTKELFIENLEEDAGSASLSPNKKYVLFEITDSKRLAGIAKVKYKEDTKEFNNPFKLLSKRPAYEPRWSPIAVNNN